MTDPAAPLTVWLLEPYFSGSHRAWAQGYAAHSRHRVHLLTMAGRFWKWRMHGGALELAAQVRARLAQEAAPDVLLAGDMVNLPAVLALVRPALSRTPVVYYAHENQLTYPPRPGEKRDLGYALINLQSMAAADLVCFNSRFHLEAWFDELPRLLKHFPDYNHLELVETLRARTRVLPLGIDLRRLNRETRPAAAERPLILWNQRWEYDKNPAEFFSALYRLIDEGYAFDVALIGENFRRAPQEFDDAAARLGPRLLQFGYVAGPQAYADWLWRADIVVSSARHEFFGTAIVEAVYCGCFPLLPRRLAYPELLPPAAHVACLYDDFDGLLQRLRRLLSHPDLPAAPGGLREAMARFDWHVQAVDYDRVMLEVAAVGRTG